MIEWLILILKIAALFVAGLMVLGLIGLGWAMTWFSWERLKELWKRE